MESYLFMKFLFTSKTAKITVIHPVYVCVCLYIRMTFTIWHKVTFCPTVLINSPLNQSVPICLHSNSAGQHLTNYKAKIWSALTHTPLPHPPKSCLQQGLNHSTQQDSCIAQKSYTCQDIPWWQQWKDNKSTLYNTTAAHLTQ